VTVQAPPAEIFDYFTDPEKATEWQSSLVEARFDPEGPMQRGTRITEVRKLLGQRMESLVEVTELEAGRRFAGRVLSGPVKWAFSYTFSEAGSGTRIESHLEGEPAGFFRLADPLLARTVRKQLEGDLATLKQLAERS
jgi:hypothetical protein